MNKYEVGGGGAERKLFWCGRGNVFGEREGTFAGVEEGVGAEPGGESKVIVFPEFARGEGYSNSDVAVDTLEFRTPNAGEVF